MADLQAALKPHAKTLDTLVDAAAQRDQPTFIAATGRLLAEIATDLPIVGKLVQTGLSVTFARTAWAQMERALAEAHTEDARRAHLADFAAMFAALLGQAFAVLVDHQEAQHDALLAAVGGLRDDLAEFRADVGRQAGGVRIEYQHVQGGLGVRVGPNAGAVVVDTQYVADGGVGVILMQHGPDPDDEVSAILDPGGIRWTPDHPSPARIFLAGAELDGAPVVPFDPAVWARERADLIDWCEDPRPARVALLTGAGGMGKTRLARELIKRQSAEQWLAGFLSASVADGDLEVLAQGTRPRLVVVDYAGSRPGVVARLLHLLAVHTRKGSGTPVRVLLLARSEGDWWPALLAADGELGEFEAAHGLRRRLTPRSLPTRQRTRLFDRAVDAFAHALDQTRPPLPPVDLQAEHFGHPLFVLLAARAALDGTLVTDATALLDGVLARESTGWVRALQGLDVPASDARRHAGWRKAEQPPKPGAAVPQAVAAATLLMGVAEPHDALPRIFSAPPPAALADLLTGLYEGTDARVGALAPDLLGEHLVATCLAHDATWLPALADWADDTPAGVEALCTVLGRMGSRVGGHDVRAWLAGVLTHDPERLVDRAGPAFRAARTLGAETAFAPIGDVLADVVSDDVEEAVFVAIDTALDAHLGSIPGQSSVPMRSLAEVVNAQRLRRADTDEARAAALNNLSVRLSELGRREDALGAIAEALEVYRRLAGVRPEAFEPDLAMSLNNLSNRLSELGRREDALGAIAEAVEIRRRLAGVRPEAFEPDLAMSLNNLSNRLSELGRREDALGAIAEAVEIRRRLAGVRPEAFEPNLAMSLNNLSGCLSELGRREDALGTIAEAVEVYRRLAGVRPEAFEPNLAASLNNLSGHLSELGRREDALGAIAEAVEIRRRLAGVRPEAFEPNLAASLNNLSGRLSELGKREDALKASVEAVSTLAPHFLRRPPAFAPWMGTMLRAYMARLDGASPDMALLGPIVGAFQAMQAGESSDDAPSE